MAPQPVVDAAQPVADGAALADQNGALAGIPEDGLAAMVQGQEKLLAAMDRLIQLTKVQTDLLMTGQAEQKKMNHHLAELVALQAAESDKAGKRAKDLADPLAHLSANVTGIGEDLAGLLGKGKGKGKSSA